MESTHPSTQIAESLSTLSHSIYKILAEAECRSQAEVARAVADALEARNDRDNAIKLLHEAQMETQEWKQEVELLKASLRQAESTVTHQTEAISLIRRESAQWKDQSRNWQEHFLRVEGERCSLATKVEDLNQILLNQSSFNTAPLTPISRYTDHDQVKESASEKYPLSPPEYDSPSHPVVSDRVSRPGPSRRKTPIPKAISRSAPSAKSIKQQSLPETVDQLHARPRKSVPQTSPRAPQSVAPQSAPQIRVIRRVQAVFDVKQEDDSDSDVFEEGSLAQNDLVYPDEADPSDSSSIVHSSKPRGSRKIGRGRLKLPSDDEEQAAALGEDAVEEDENEDELMITSQYSQVVPLTNKRATTQNMTAPPSKKRKANPASRFASRKKP